MNTKYVFLIYSDYHLNDQVYFSVNHNIIGILVASISFIIIFGFGFGPDVHHDSSTTWSPSCSAPSSCCYCCLYISLGCAFFFFFNLLITDTGSSSVYVIFFFNPRFFIYFCITESSIFQPFQNLQSIL